jgi:hypothetical protein
LLDSPNGPDHHDVGVLRKLTNRRRIQEALMHRDAVEPTGVCATTEFAQLTLVPDGEHCAHSGFAAKRLEESPASRADGDPWRAASARRKRLEDETRQANVTPFEVKHDLGRRRQSPKKITEQEARRERITQLPPIPKDR